MVHQCITLLCAHALCFNALHFYPIVMHTAHLPHALVLWPLLYTYLLFSGLLLLLITVLSLLSINKADFVVQCLTTPLTLQLYLFNWQPNNV
jgi:hypothetical protein